jgi:pentatricopeptide repeat protein
MYAKCGSIEEAWRVINIMPTDNLAKWNAILEAYAIHGHVNEALGLFERMCDEGVKIDKLTFLSLLSACGRAGLVDEALYYFGSMTSDHRISATEEHYTCMVDLLGCAGRLDEAEDLIKMMPCEPSASLWKALLGACKIHSNVEMGERIAKKVLEVDPKDATCYALLSEIHAATEKL